MDYERLYAYRFRGVEQSARDAVWTEIAPFLYRAMGSPSCVLDAAAGRGEFIRHVPAADRWALDRVRYDVTSDTEGVTWVQADLFEAELPSAHFGGILLSNVLEHLPTPDGVADALARARTWLAPGGAVVVMGPNFKHCVKEYFDCADHTLALTEVAIAEHLYAAGYEVERVVGRFLPYSFRGRLPPSAVLTRLYLRAPFLWHVLGRQYLVVGRRSA